MTPRDRVLAAIEHQPTDRLPYCVLLTGEMREALTTRHGIPDPQAWLDNDVALVSPPWWQWHELGPAWQAMDPPSTRPTVLGRGDYAAFADTIARVRETTGRYVLVTIYGSHFEKAYFARGIENFLADIAGEYAFAKRLCREIVEKNLVMLENFLALEAIDGVLLGSDWGSQRGPLMAPDVWDDLIRPGEQAEYDLIHAYSKDVWVHSCGDIAVLLPRLVDMGVDVLNPLQPECMDIAQVKADFGPDLTFWGGLSTQQTLPFGTPEAVRAEARRVYDLLGAGGGYVAAPAQAIQTDVPLANLEAMLEIFRTPTHAPAAEVA